MCSSWQIIDYSNFVSQIQSLWYKLKACDHSSTNVPIRSIIHRTINIFLGKNVPQNPSTYSSKYQKSFIEQYNITENRWIILFRKSSNSTATWDIIFAQSKDKHSIWLCCGRVVYRSKINTYRQNKTADVDRFILNWDKQSLEWECLFLPTVSSDEEKERERDRGRSYSNNGALIIAQI